MNTQNNKKKNYIIIMIIGIVLNLSLYYVAHFFHLPVWMDSIGTAYAAAALEPAAGLLVGFAANFYQAAFIYDSSSLIYYMVSAIAALAFGIVLRKNGKLALKRMPLAMLAYFIPSTLAAAGLTMWKSGGVPESAWENHFYEIALSYGCPNIIACLFGTLVLKIFDTIIIAVFIPCLCMLTKKWTNLYTQPVVSWKNPFFIKK